MKKLILFLLLLVGVGVFMGVSAYNRLVPLDEAVSQQWSEVENAYQRRADLIPNLVETVRGAADFERETLESVVEARARVGQVSLTEPPDAEELARFQAAQSELSSALSRLLVVVEQYPELRATEAFRDLQAQLEGTENRIAVARRDYIQAVQVYNTELRTFPGRIWAAILYSDMEPRETFTQPESLAQPPQVNFN